MERNRFTYGFTLIELMVVIIIIAALAGMVLPRVLPASEEAKKSIARADIANITVGLKLYRLHHDTYPTTEQGLDVLMTPPDTADWSEPYLESSPIDPWDRSYQYRYPGQQNPSGFDLWSQGPDETSSEDDITNWER
jgi:general secretion pathway protein G